MKKVKAKQDEFCAETSHRINKGEACLQDPKTGEFYSYASITADKFVVAQIRRSNRNIYLVIICCSIAFLVFVLLCLHQYSTEAYEMPH